MRAGVPVCASQIKRNIEKILIESWGDLTHLAPRAASLSQIHVSPNELHTKMVLFTKFETQLYHWTPWRSSPPPRSLCSQQPRGWREATAAAIHMEKIIVNEKSLRGIMLSTGSLFPFPPSALRSTRRSGGFSLSFGIQELLPGN